MVRMTSELPAFNPIRQPSSSQGVASWNSGREPTLSSGEQSVGAIRSCHWNWAGRRSCGRRSASGGRILMLLVAAAILAAVELWHLARRNWGASSRNL